LFYRAAEHGHRFSRQRIRELLAKIEYQPWLCAKGTDANLK
jgi:hypothetical protein